MALDQRLCEAVDGTQRRSQVVGYRVAEALELLVRLRQRLFDAAPLREIAGHLAQKRVPSLRTRHPSSSCLPSRSAIPISHCGLPCATSSGG